MQIRKKKLGQLRLENLISAFSDTEPGEPAVIIEHKVDNPTLVILGVITIGAVILNYYLFTLK